MVVLTGAATVTMESADLDHDFTLQEHQGQDGCTETLIGSDEKFNCTINFAPNGATRAAAINSAANSWPAMLTKVVLSGFAIAKYNTNYNYIGGATAKTTSSGIAIMGIKLRNYVPNNASLTANVITG